LINDYISIGKITSTFGLKGLLKVVSSGDILSSLKPNSEVFLQTNGDFKSYKLLAIRKNKNVYILSIDGFDSIGVRESGRRQ
jgi:ribosomal 30S subunit maturation factor RimM